MAFLKWHAVERQNLHEGRARVCLPCGLVVRLNPSPKQISNRIFFVNHDAEVDWAHLSVNLVQLKSEVVMDWRTNAAFWLIQNLRMNVTTEFRRSCLPAC